MFNFCSLYSGSSGNSLFVETTKTKLLIDAGVSCKKIVNALDSLNIPPENLDGILITHEHIDHVQSLSTLSNRFNIPVYINYETLVALPKSKNKLSDNNIKLINTSSSFSIGDIDVKPFSIPHDAANPSGFCLFNKSKKISIATDIGNMNKNILKILEDSNFILLESNYDPNVLKYAPYPYKLKSRIAGPKGHLSNEIAGKTISYLLNSNLSSAMLRSFK